MGADDPLILTHLDMIAWSMTEKETHRYRAGGSVEDLCRACKQDRRHTVVVAGSDGKPVRVLCDYCGSQHNFRGGPRGPVTSPQRGAGPVGGGGDPFELVSERERSSPPMSDHGGEHDLEMMLRTIIREESGLTPVAPSDKWRGGDLVLRPGRDGLQDKTIPIETFFHKIVMLRNRLRVMEQQINGSELPDDAKVKLQGYITACYGSLTSFNVLFADEDDRFRGGGSK